MAAKTQGVPAWGEEGPAFEPPRARIVAVELKNIGPYRKKARLDFRDLTIVCGTNGSGKSTWLRTLQWLRDQSQPPGNWLATMREEATDLVFSREYTDGRKPLPNSASIALTLKVLAGGRGFFDALPNAPVRYVTTSEVKELFGKSKRKKTQRELEAEEFLKLDPEPGTEVVVRLAFRPSDRGARPARVSVSWGEHRYAVDPDVTQRAPRAAVDRIGYALKGSLHHFLHVAAVRPLEISERGVPDYRNAPPYVGEDGAESHKVLSDLRNTVLVPVSLADLWEVEDVGRVPEDAERHLGSYTPPSTRLGESSKAAKLLKKVLEDVTSVYTGTTSDTATANDDEALERAFAAALEGRPLPDPGGLDALAELTRFYQSPRGPHGERPNDEQRRLGERTWNLLALLKAIHELRHDYHVQEDVDWRGVIPTLEYHYSAWMHFLTEVGVPEPYGGEVWAGRPEVEADARPADAMFRMSQARYAGHLATGSGDRARYVDLKNVHIQGPPKAFSAGYHQVSPLVVQMLVAQTGATVCFENPEVHLHPRAQCRMAETLLACAKSGRQVVAETHSDLVVRRALRAMLEEDLPQSRIAIYFTSTGPSGAKLSRLTFDEYGRVKNWPQGFLTDDVDESQRLLDVVYGGAAEDAGDES